MSLYRFALKLFAPLLVLLVSPLLCAQTTPKSDPVAPKEDPVAQEDIESQADPNALAAIDLYAKGDVEGAYQLFKKTYDANPDSDPPGVLLALLHSTAGRFLEMRRALEQTAEDYPSDPEAFLQLAGVDIQEGRFLEARLLIERAEKLVDAYPEARPESDSRLAYLREETLSARANLAERRERYDEAKQLVQKIVDINPNNPQAYWNLGYLSMKLRQYDDAEKAFDKAAELNNELWPGWLQVASSLDREDLVEEGKSRLELHQDELENASKSCRAQVARLFLRWDMLEEAAKIVEEFATANDEKDLDRWLLSGWVALYSDKYRAAEDFFRNATLVDPESFEASNGLALALLDQSNKEKLARARVIAAKNYAAYPDNQEAAVTYAWTLFLSGRQKEASDIFSPILSSGEMTATVAYYLAEIANYRGDREMALTLLKLACSQKSNFPKRNAALELRRLLEEGVEPPTNPFDDFDDEPDFGEQEEESETSSENNADSQADANADLDVDSTPQTN